MGAWPRAAPLLQAGFLLALLIAAFSEPWLQMGRFCCVCSFLLHFLCREWVLKSSILIAMAVYTYLRLIVDHHGTAPLQALRQKEVDFCISLLRERVSRAEPSVCTLCSSSSAGRRLPCFLWVPANPARGSSPLRPRSRSVSSPHPSLPAFLSSLRVERGPMSQPPASETG